MATLPVGLDRVDVGRVVTGSAAVWVGAGRVGSTWPVRAVSGSTRPNTCYPANQGPCDVGSRDSRCLVALGTVRTPFVPPIAVRPHLIHGLAGVRWWVGGVRGGAPGALTARDDP